MLLFIGTVLAAAPIAFSGEGQHSGLDSVSSTENDGSRIPCYRAKVVFQPVYRVRTPDRKPKCYKFETTGAVEAGKEYALGIQTPESCRILGDVKLKPDEKSFQLVLIEILEPEVLAPPRRIIYEELRAASRPSSRGKNHFDGEYVYAGNAVGEFVRDLRKHAERAIKLAPELPTGWALSKSDPTAIVQALPPLSLKEGLVLRGYECGFGLNSVGRVLALPNDAAYPGQNGAPVKGDLRGIERPDGATEDVMDAIQGDGSAWSYLLASVLKRQLDEFGARWHGQRWSTHTLLFEDPWKDNHDAGDAVALMRPTGQPDEGGGDDVRFRFGRPTRQLERWEWKSKKPNDWSARVLLSEKQVTVSFYTYSPLGQEAIYKHVDTYARGTYRCASESKAIARGPRRMVF